MNSDGSLSPTTITTDSFVCSGSFFLACFRIVTRLHHKPLITSLFQHDKQTDGSLNQRNIFWIEGLRASKYPELNGDFTAFS